MAFSGRCSRCGSNSFRADRSLAGRLVCTKCGTPAGQGNINRTYQRNTRSINRRWKWWLIGLGVLILVVILQSA